MYFLCLLAESGKDASASSDQGEETDHNKSESEDEEQQGKKSRQKPVRKMKRVTDSEDSSDEERVASVKKVNETNSTHSPSKNIKNKDAKIKKETAGNQSPSQGRTASQSDAESDSDSDSSCHKDDGNKGRDTSDESEEGDYPNFIPSFGYIYFFNSFHLFVCFLNQTTLLLLNFTRKRKRPCGREK